MSAVKSTMSAASGNGSWAPRPSLPAPNAWLGAAWLQGAVYAVGGGLFYGRNETSMLVVGGER